MINVVIIEDDETQQILYKDTIFTYNITADLKIKDTYYKDDSELAEYLMGNRCDCLILDLDWGNGVTENSGNQLLLKIIKAQNIPVFIVSGNLAQLDVEYVESSILKKYNRDTDFSDILNAVVDVYRCGYTRVLGSHGLLDKIIKEVFWSETLNKIEVWKNTDEEVQNLRISRFTMTRVAEQLGFRNGDSDLHSSVEFYITTQYKTKLFTGDIVSNENINYVVLTAACDIEQDKNDYYMLGVIDRGKLDHEKNRAERKVTKEDKENIIKPFVNNAKNRYHLIPPVEGIEGGLLDFQNIKSVCKDDIGQFKYVATIAPNFSKDIQSRFSNYYSRQGQPQLSCEEICNTLSLYD